MEQRRKEDDDGPANAQRTTVGVPTSRTARSPDATAPASRRGSAGGSPGSTPPARNVGVRLTQRGPRLRAVGAVPLSRRTPTAAGPPRRSPTSPCSTGSMYSLGREISESSSQDHDDDALHQERRSRRGGPPCATPTPTTTSCSAVVSFTTPASRFGTPSNICAPLSDDLVAATEPRLRMEGLLAAVVRGRTTQAIAFGVVCRSSRHAGAR